jgi:hypothetical protein
VSRTAAQLIAARQLAIQYREMAKGVEEDARDPKLRGKPVTQGILRNYAAIARRAAIAEELDPQWGPRGCGICGGTTTCQAV